MDFQPHTPAVKSKKKKIQNMLLFILLVACCIGSYFLFFGSEVKERPFILQINPISLPPNFEISRQVLNDRSLITAKAVRGDNFGITTQYKIDSVKILSVIDNQITQIFNKCEVISMIDSLEEEFKFKTSFTFTDSVDIATILIYMEKQGEVK